MPLKVLTRSYRGEEKISTVPIEIPANAVGPALDARHRRPAAERPIEQRELRRTLQPQSVAQLIRVLNETRRNNRVYVRLLTGTPGAVVNGEALTSLPPSVLSVLEGDRSGGSFTPIRSATLGEWELPMDSAVTRLARPHHRSRQRFRPLMPSAVHSSPSQPMRTGVRCLRLRWRLSPPPGPVLRAATPTFWTVVDPGRFPEGRRREPVDRQRRPRVPRAGDRARRRDGRAVPVDGARRAPTARSGPAPATRARS